MKQPYVTLQNLTKYLRNNLMESTQVRKSLLAYNSYKLILVNTYNKYSIGNNKDVLETQRTTASLQSLRIHFRFRIKETENSKKKIAV